MKSLIDFVLKGLKGFQNLLDLVRNPLVLLNCGLITINQVLVRSYVSMVTWDSSDALCRDHSSSEFGITLANIAGFCATGDYRFFVSAPALECPSLSPYDPFVTTSAGSIGIFILLHEFAHIILGHIDNSNTCPLRMLGVTSADKYDRSVQQEFEADRNIFRGAQQATRRRGAEVSSARADLAEATSERAELDVLQANLQRLHSERTQAELKLEQASTELDYHTMLSPTDGVIDELFVDAGEFVASGQRVLVMHNPEKIWIKANVKETDLKHISVGGKVSITVDAYPDETRSGTVSRIGGAARSQFALLPNPNPSGNFTKSTQRVETTIELEKHDPRLKPGMMVEIKLPRR